MSHNFEKLKELSEKIEECLPIAKQELWSQDYFSLENVLNRILYCIEDNEQYKFYNSKDSIPKT